MANETVAGHLERCRVPVLFRVHEAPDPSKIAEFEAFTASLGFSLGVPADRVAPGDFRRLLERLRGEPAERPVAFLMLRAMQQARYDPANLGHFGLAASTYTHFTSPIRRYPDLIVHPGAAGVACPLARRGRARRLAGGSAGAGPPHVGQGASRGGGRARDRAVEEGALHGGQGRRRVHRLRDRRHRVRSLRRAHRALRRGARAHFQHGGRLLPLRRGPARAARREHAQGLPAGRSRARAAREGRPGPPPTGAGAGRDPRQRAAGRRGARAGPGAGAAAAARRRPARAAAAAGEARRRAP